MGIRFISFSFCFGYCYYISSLYNPTEYEQLKEMCAFATLCLVTHSSLKYFMQTSSSEMAGLIKFCMIMALPFFILFNYSTHIEQPTNLQNVRQQVLLYGSVIVYISFIVNGIHGILKRKNVAIYNITQRDAILDVSEQRSQSENTTRETSKNASANIDDLEEAIRNENLKKIKKIINYGADVNAVDNDGTSPLMIAAGNSKNTEIIKILIEAGADVNAKGELGVTPLICAAYSNKNPEIIKMLADSGANVNEKANTNLTPLMAAAHYNKNPQIVTTLINLGAEINARDDEGRTALDYAKENNNEVAEKVLRQITISNTTNTEVNYRNQAQQENITTTRRRRVIQTQNSQEDRTPTKHKGRRLDL